MFNSIISKMANAELQITAILEEWEKHHPGMNHALASKNANVSGKVNVIMTMLEKTTGEKLIATFRGIKDKKSNKYHPIVNISTVADYRKVIGE